MSLIRYYPRLQNHAGVYRGYSELTEAQKGQILPIFEIGQRKAGERFANCLAQISEVIGDRRFILDIGDFPAPEAFLGREHTDREAEKAERLQAQQDRFNNNRLALFDDDDGHANWRTQAAGFPNCIPCLQYSDLETQTNAIIRQGARFIRDGFEELAIRIDVSTGSVAADYGVIGNLIALLGSPANLFIVLDAGLGRRNTSEKISKANSVIQAVEGSVQLQELAFLKFVFFGESFTKPHKKGLFNYEDYYWEVLEETRAKSQIGQGDYATFAPTARRNTYITGNWLASCVYPLVGEWLVYRDPNSRRRSGWSEGCRLITDNDSFRAVVGAWGDEIVQAAATGRDHDANSASDWYGVRVNLHIVNQINAFVDYEG